MIILKTYSTKNNSNSDCLKRKLYWFKNFSCNFVFYYEKVLTPKFCPLYCQRADISDQDSERFSCLDHITAATPTRFHISCWVCSDKTISNFISSLKGWLFSMENHTPAYPIVLIMWRSYISYGYRSSNDLVRLVNYHSIMIWYEQYNGDDILTLQKTTRTKPGEIIVHI